MLMRLAISIHGMDVDRVIETYDLISTNFYTHASSTMFNAGTESGHLSSSYLLQLHSGGIERACETSTDCAVVSIDSGDIGLGAQLVTASGLVAFILCP